MAQRFAERVRSRLGDLAWLAGPTAVIEVPSVAGQVSPVRWTELRAGDRIEIGRDRATVVRRHSRTEISQSRYGWEVSGEVSDERIDLGLVLRSEHVDTWRPPSVNKVITVYFTTPVRVSGPSIKFRVRDLVLHAVGVPDSIFVSEGHSTVCASIEYEDTTRRRGRPASDLDSWSRDYGYSAKASDYYPGVNDDECAVVEEPPRPGMIDWATVRHHGWPQESSTRKVWDKQSKSWRPKTEMDP